MLPVRFRKHSKDLALPDGNPYVFSVANPFEAESPRSIEDESAVSPSWAVDPNSSNDQNIAANKSEMTEDELADLTYAFQAADVDGGGSIDPEEFEMMLVVMGCKITMEQVMEVINEAKAGFAVSKRMADKEHIEKCQRIWDEYDKDKNDMLDLGEVNAVIKKLQAMVRALQLFVDLTCPHV